MRPRAIATGFVLSFTSLLLSQESAPASRRSESRPVVRISGRVVDSAGAPIANARVTLGNPGPPRLFIGPLLKASPQTWTNATGTYALEAINEVTYEVAASHVDYAPAQSEPFVASSGNEKRPDIVMTRGGRVRGIVKLADGKPDSRAMVQLVAAEKPPGALGYLVAYCDREGRFEFFSVPPGSHSLTVVQRDGKPDLDALFNPRASPKTVTVRAGESAEVEL